MIQTEDSSRTSFGNNSTSIPYPIPFYFPFDTDLKVVARNASGVETDLVLGTDYTLTGAGDPNGGSLKTLWPVPTNSTLTIFRSVPATQLTSYEEGDSFPAKSHERALDKLTMLVQQSLRVTGGGDPENLAQAFRLSEASAGINAVAQVNDTTLGLDSLGNAVLRTPGEMLGWLGQVGTVWPDTPARLTTRGAYPGQLGVQIDNGTIYIAHSTTPGDWFPFLIGTGIVTAINGVPSLMTPPAGDLVGTDESQVLENKTLIAPQIIDPTGLDKNDVGLSQVDNVSDINKPISTQTGIALGGKEDKDQKGVVGGYPSLDGGGKIPLAQIPDSVIGASQYKGTWNASTNSPSITTGSAPGKTGWYYAVAVAGTTTVDGISSWAVGDQIISNGTVWQKIVNVSAVSSVNTKTGAVVINKTDVGLSNVDNTSDATKNAAVATLTNKTIAGANNTLTVRLDADVVNNLPVARLNSGTGASGTTWWCGDGSWKQPPGTGDVNGPTGSGDGELALYSGTTGKIIRRFSGTAGFAKSGPTGLLTTVPLIHGPDLDPDVISAQTVLSNTDPNKNFLLVYDQSANQLRKASSISVGRCPRGHLWGMQTGNDPADSANDIFVTPGICRDSTDTYDIKLSTQLVKRLDAAWAAGTNQGGRDGSALAAGSWHAFVIYNPTTNAAEVILGNNYAGPSPLPSGYTAWRRVGSFTRVGSINTVRTDIGNNDYFFLPTPSPEMADGLFNPSMVGTFTMAGIPKTGRPTLVHCSVRMHNTLGASAIIVRHPTQQNAPSSTVWVGTANITNANAGMTLLLNENSEYVVFVASSPTTSVTHVWVDLLGWWDDREKYA
jgi:hypothetical protein